jgi:hypothetical protein
MSTTYGIEVIQLDMECWLTELAEALEAELMQIGLHHAVAVEVREGAFSADEPSIAVYYGTTDASLDTGVRERLRRALADGVPVIPVVENLGQFSVSVPQELQALNGWEWSGQDPARRLARILLEELGIEDRRRRVFISHKREDGMAAAQQLHDELSHHRFVPFIDRFDIRFGEPVQEKIADALEDHAFMLLLETPEAHDSKWVFDEVTYALSHFMGILILQWPGEPKPVPGSDGLDRLALSSRDIERDQHGFDVLTGQALEMVLRRAEEAHAVGIVRRRRMLTLSVEESARAAGCSKVRAGRGVAAAGGARRQLDADRPDTAAAERRRPPTSG